MTKPIKHLVANFQGALAYTLCGVKTKQNITAYPEFSTCNKCLKLAGKKLKAVHWEGTTPGSTRTFCGRKIGAVKTTPDIHKTSCLLCRDQAALHGHLSVGDQ